MFQCRIYLVDFSISTNGAFLNNAKLDDKRSQALSKPKVAFEIAYVATTEKQYIRLKYIT